MSKEALASECDSFRTRSKGPTPAPARSPDASRSPARVWGRSRYPSRCSRTCRSAWECPASRVV